MGLYIKTLLLFAFLKFSIIHGQNLCLPSFCGRSMLAMLYPFKLEYQTPTNNCTYYNLACNPTQSKTILNLPHAGEFYVENIDYVREYIQLYDPENCLINRLMNVSLDFSPFKARYANYTFYVCPLGSKVLDSYVRPIDCLSNSTNITIATRDPELVDVHECRVIGSWLLPVQDYGIFDDSYLFLIWNASVCQDCQESHDHELDDRGTKPIAKIVAVAMSMPALMILGLSCCSVFCVHLMNMIADKYEDDLAVVATAAPTTMVTPQTTVATTLPPPSTTSNTGLDESKIMACTELVVLSESGEGIASANCNMCSICLENYCQKETVSVISKCGHCFHANCIQQWLGKNGSCPVCRTSLSDVACNMF